MEISQLMFASLRACILLDDVIMLVSLFLVSQRDYGVHVCLCVYLSVCLLALSAIMLDVESSLCQNIFRILGQRSRS